MKPILNFLLEENIVLSDYSIIDIDSQDLEELIRSYSKIVIDEYERKLYEYDGSVTYSHISNELKSEL